MIYFTADIHFYHENIINHTKRPFKNADEMNRKIIANWNNIVKANDEVYILGDVTMKGASNANTVLSQLKGKKYLIKGNHEFYRGAYHLHGHQHNNSLYNFENLKKGLRRYDVGVDANNFKPISIDEIIKFFEMI